MIKILKMKSDFSTSFTVPNTAQEVFDAITNVRAWWAGTVEGESKKTGDEFTYRYKNMHYSRHRLTEVIPCKKITWETVESALNFVENQQEWAGTTIDFDITASGGTTTLRFTHHGLQPFLACYNDCTNAWNHYINGCLRELVLLKNAENHCG